MKILKNYYKFFILVFKAFTRTYLRKLCECHTSIYTCKFVIKLAPYLKSVNIQKIDSIGAASFGQLDSLANNISSTRANKPYHLGSPWMDPILLPKVTCPAIQPNLLQRSRCNDKSMK